MKLFISGVSGIGKTTLAETISNQYGIPFIIGSTKLIWGKYGIKSHADIISMCNNQPKIGLKFQMEILEYRLSMMENNQDFVSDRSPVDNVVYTLTQLSHVISEKELKQYIDRCAIAYNSEDVRHLHLGASENLFLNIPLENDSMRVNNLYYQLMVNSLFDTVIGSNWLNINKDNFREIRNWDMNSRVKLAEELIFKYK